eukprot:6467627-Amphidinium_carterae.1
MVGCKRLTIFSVFWGECFTVLAQVIGGAGALALEVVSINYPTKFWYAVDLLPMCSLGVIVACNGKAHMVGTTPWTCRCVLYVQQQLRSSSDKCHPPLVRQSDPN